jgi:hypothetical protein
MVIDMFRDFIYVGELEEKGSQEVSREANQEAN